MAGFDPSIEASARKTGSLTRLRVGPRTGRSRPRQPAEIIVVDHFTAERTASGCARVVDASRSWPAPCSVWCRCCNAPGRTWPATDLPLRTPPRQARPPPGLPAETLLQAGRPGGPRGCRRSKRARLAALPTSRWWADRGLRCWPRLPSGSPAVAPRPPDRSSPSPAPAFR